MICPAFGLQTVWPMSANPITNISPHTIPTTGADPKLSQSGNLRDFSWHDYSAIDRWSTGGSEVQRDWAIVNLLEGVRRRWRRERRRRAVGRAYDMALEIARYVPYGSEVLDVGCGNGLIAHHLSAILGTVVLGIDLSENTRAPIAYQRYDGSHFPVTDKSLDAVLLCYVLHHAQDLGLVLVELSRVLRDHGTAIVYEDMPGSIFDRGVCWSHNLQWRHRT